MHLGHVHLKVSNLDRAEEFYTKILGFKITEKIKNQFLFLTLGKHHHDVALMHIPNAPKPPQYSTGLYHVAFEVTLEEFKERYAFFESRGLEPEAVDHGISYAFYFADPDENVIEFYVDTRDRLKDWNGHTISLRSKDVAQL